MFKKFAIGLTLMSVLFLTGCASVPMGSKEQDVALKKFTPPPADKAGLYIYRNTFGGQALKKTVYIDGKSVGETANKVYFYAQVAPGSHTLSTESEFSNNAITMDAEGGKNYFFEQEIKMGVFVGGAKLFPVGFEVGQAAVLECELAEPQPMVK